VGGGVKKIWKTGLANLSDDYIELTLYGYMEDKGDQASRPSWKNNM
jgi:hypothetical protein